MKNFLKKLKIKIKRIVIKIKYIYEKISKKVVKTINEMLEFMVEFGPFIVKSLIDYMVVDALLRTFKNNPGMFLFLLTFTKVEV